MTAPGVRRSLLGKVTAALSSRKRSKPARMAAIAAKAREHVVTMAALGSFDMGAFHVPWHLGQACGWIAICVSLLAADFAVRG